MSRLLDTRGSLPEANHAPRTPATEVAERALRYGRRGRHPAYRRASPPQCSLGRFFSWPAAGRCHSRMTQRKPMWTVVRGFVGLAVPVAGNAGSSWARIGGSHPWVPVAIVQAAARALRRPPVRAGRPAPPAAPVVQWDRSGVGEKVSCPGTTGCPGQRPCPHCHHEQCDRKRCLVGSDAGQRAGRPTGREPIPGSTCPGYPGQERPPSPTSNTESSHPVSWRSRCDGGPRSSKTPTIVSTTPARAAASSSAAPTQSKCATSSTSHATSYHDETLKHSADG